MCTTSLRRKRLIEYVKGTIIRRRRTLSAAALIVIALVTVFNSDLSPDLYFVHWGPLEDVSCHYSPENATAAGVPELGAHFAPPPASVYFVETSCRGALRPRQACAVESAARALPAWRVHLLLAGPAPRAGVLAVLARLRNVRVRRVRVLQLARGTPAEALVRGGALARTRWRVSHASDLLRLLVLYRWGGVYLDLDVVVRRPLDALARNWAARESDDSASVGALAFSRDALGRAVAAAALQEFVRGFRGDDWSHNGPGVMTRVLRRLCRAARLPHMTAATCDGFEVYGPELFYPIPWREAHRYMEADDFTGDPYIHHVWNKFTKDLPIKKDSLYSKLAQKYCPTIYEAFKDNFGD